MVSYSVLDYSGDVSLLAINSVLLLGLHFDSEEASAISSDLIVKEGDDFFSHSAKLIPCEGFNSVELLEPTDESLNTLFFSIFKGGETTKSESKSFF